MKLLIIGGTGNISTPITKNLQGREDEITLFNYDKTRPEWLMDKVRVISGNRADMEKHTAEIFHNGNFDCVIDMICFEPADAAIDVRLFKNRTRQFIFCSTVDVYPKTGSHYPVTEDTEIGALKSFPYAYKKVECEKIFWQAHREKAFQLTVIRPAATFNETWSPGVHSFGGQTYHLDRILKGKPIIMHGDGTSVWTASYRDNTATAFLGAIGNEKAFGQAYNANGDEMFTMNFMWQTIARIMKAPEPDFVFIPTNYLYKMAPAETEWCLENFMHNNILDNSKAKQDLGYTYKISYEEGVRRCFEYLRLHELIEDSSKYPFYENILLQWQEMTGKLM